jgi:hypothetical protein
VNLPNQGGTNQQLAQWVTESPSPTQVAASPGEQATVHVSTTHRSTTSTTTTAKYDAIVPPAAMTTAGSLPGTLLLKALSESGSKAGSAPPTARTVRSTRRLLYSHRSRSQLGDLDGASNSRSLSREGCSGWQRQTVVPRGERGAGEGTFPTNARAFWFGRVKASWICS